MSLFNWLKVLVGRSDPCKVALANQVFHGTHPIRVTRSIPLRLVGPIIAVLLAITMAIFPISVPHAAVSGVHNHAAAHGHDHQEHAVEASVSCDHQVVEGQHSEHEGTPDGAGSSCCSIGGCHAVHVSLVAGLPSPAVAPLPSAISGDEQVDGVISGRLDRPPRTV